MNIHLWSGKPPARAAVLLVSVTFKSANWSSEDSLQKDSLLVLEVKWLRAWLRTHSTVPWVSHGGYRKGRPRHQPSQGCPKHGKWGSHIDSLSPGPPSLPHPSTHFLKNRHQSWRGHKGQSYSNISPQPTDLKDLYNRDACAPHPAFLIQLVGGGDKNF